ncbi:MAG: CDP-alcohol phosphatidyltransferase family protein [Anaerolineaceae bacterium]|nr:CDP-alcohol phosphatidyltransferase family protein [Anaerolineaceae bacterium]
MSEKVKGKNPVEDFLRKTFHEPLNWIASKLLKIGLTPNHITFLGLLGNIGAAVLIGFGQIQWAGLLAVLMAPLDAVDGAMARLRGNNSKFGAFFDSVIDRYDELFLFGGLLIWFYTQENLLGIILSFLSAMGAVLVSYTRARAEGLGISTKVGIMTRIERAIVLILGLLIGKPIWSVGIIALFANITAIQRIVYVWRESQAE